MFTGVVGKKVDQTQGFLEDGTRVPLTIVKIKDAVVTQVKTNEKDGYNAVQLGLGMKKRGHRALVGHSKKAGVEHLPRFFREIRLENTADIALGGKVSPSDVFQPGDIVNASGVSKGKGFAGGVKRHHFKGGPRTHGQSDRERAPGSIGQTTTPGRVYKGKRMAGRMGGKGVTIKNLAVVSVTDDEIWVKGVIPGPRDSVVTLIKVGSVKKFVPLFKEVDEKAAAVETQAEEEEKKAVTEEKEVQPEEVKVEEKEEAKKEKENAS